jgi:hypothetical protein
MYPFVPKSNANLQPGDFWALPLSDGSYACGRVLQLPPAGRPGSKVSFLGGLLDWRANSQPTSHSIAGARVLEQGAMHVLAIQNSGGQVLGNRPLGLDAMGPLECINGNTIQIGYTPVRAWRREDTAQLPTFSTWGYDFILLRAHKHFLGYLPSDA